YEPGKIHRSDRMASTGLYEDGKKGIRRLTDPDLRLKEQDRDGVQAEVLYGILGATNRLNDNEAAGTMLRIYNDWLADFCGHHPERFAGLANIPNHSVEEAVTEIERVAKRGNVRGLEVARRHDMTPLWDPWWNPVWDAIAPSGLPVHFDPIGVKLIDELGVDNIMWGSDFPHPDGIWPDSQEYIQKELGHLPEAVRKKIVCDNAAKLYRFVN